jgi:hypothetical protein
VLGAGLLDLVGPRDATAQQAEGSIEVVVRYDAVTRPGLAATWEVEITSVDGAPLPERIDVTTTSSYFDLFDENALSPEPVEETTDAEHSTWTFLTAPGSRSFTVSLDARVQPGWRGSERGTTTVSAGDEPPVSVSYRTRLMP